MSKPRVRIFGVIAIVVVALGAIFIPQYFIDTPDDEAPVAVVGQKRPPLPVYIYVAEPSFLVDGIPTSGSLMPNEEVDISSEISGKVTHIYFSEGTQVAKGEILVKVNDEDLQAQLKRAKFQESLLAERLERQRILLQREAISREAFDQLQTDYNMLQADIELLNVRIDKTEIKAPFAGVIGFRYISEGSYVQPSTPITSLIDKSVLKVEFSIPEKYVNRSLLNSTITFSTENSTDQYTARIYAIESQLDSKTRTMTLRALYNNAGMILSPGMSARVTVASDTKNDAIMIPSEAIIPALDGKSVWLMRGGKAVQTQIETGIRTASTVEVTEGVALGDTLITTGILQLREGMDVIASEQ